MGTALMTDPTFYPSPGMAMKAPPEHVAYVSLLNFGNNGHHDALGIINVDSESKGYGQLVDRVEFPGSDNELHHFGWNACSACLCPQNPHPHMERRYLVVPGIASSRIHILDTKPDGKAGRNVPKIVKVIEPEEFTKKTGYTSPHTIHCGPDGIYGSALGSATGDGPGGIFLMDADTFELKGQWEKERGPQSLAYDFWWHLGHDTMITSEWGTPNMVKDGVNPELLLGGKYGHKLHIWDLDKRRHLQELDLGAEQQMVLELRPSHDPNKTFGFVGVVVSLKDLSSSIWMWYREGSTAPEGLQGGAPAGDRHQPLTRRSLPIRIVLGNWGIHSVRRVQSGQPQEDRLASSRRDRAPGGPSAEAPASPQRRSADGRNQPRWQTPLLYERALLPLGRAVLSRRSTQLDGEGRRKPRRRNQPRSRVFCRV
jgi:hypothetical protein